MTRRTAGGDEASDPLPESLSAPARRALANAGLTTFGQLTAVKRRDLLALHGMGPKAVATLESALASSGGSLAD